MVKTTTDRGLCVRRSAEHMRPIRFFQTLINTPCFPDEESEAQDPEVTCLSSCSCKCLSLYLNSFNLLNPYSIFTWSFFKKKTWCTEFLQVKVIFSGKWKSPDRRCAPLLLSAHGARMCPGAWPLRGAASTVQRGPRLDLSSLHPEEAVRGAGSGEGLPASQWGCDSHGSVLPSSAPAKTIINIKG